MKRTISLLGLLLVMITGYPLLVITGWVREFTVTVKYPLITFSVLTLLFSSGSLHLLLNKEKMVNMVTSILSALLVPASAAWLLACVWENRSFLIFLLALVWVTLSFALMFTHGNEVHLKGVVAGLSLLVLVLLVLFLGFLLVFTIGQNTVVQTLSSPQGNYYAVVIDSDQGALGGDTLVEVYDTRKMIDLFVLSVQKEPQLVYLGDWGEFKNMKLQWKSEQVLMINGRTYEVE